MALDNQGLSALAWINGSTEYKNRIPEPTRDNIKDVVDALFDPANLEWQNEFISFLFNRIGWEIFRSNPWYNPLQALQGRNVSWGEFIQETAFNLITAEEYDPTAQDLLAINPPDGKTAMHRLNRRNKYRLSINSDMLHNAFTSGTGLNNFVSSALQSIYNSSNLDEYRILMQVLKEYDDKYGITAITITGSTDQEKSIDLLKKIRTYSGLMRYPRSTWTASELDSRFINPDQLFLLTTPEVQASIDVDALAPIFNLSKAEPNTRIVVVDEFHDTTTKAVLTSTDFWIWHHNKFQATTFYDPNNLHTHYWLHVWGWYSASPFIPIIKFTE